MLLIVLAAGLCVVVAMTPARATDGSCRVQAGATRA
jgi:hypothetical protein